MSVGMEVEDEPVHGEDAYAEEMSFDDVVGYRDKKDDGRVARTSKDSRGLQKKKSRPAATRSGEAGDIELVWETQSSIGVPLSAKGLTIAQ
jgi:hypothetical protein